MDNVLDILKSVGAIIANDHFVYTSGKHGDAYINKDALYPHTEKASEIGRLFAEKNKELEIDAVVGPALGGIILSQWTSYHLSKIKGKEILGVYTEKDSESNQVFSRRGYNKLIEGKNVLVVEDLTNTGGSVKKVVDTVRASGATVTHVCVMVNRNPQEVNEKSIGAPLSSLAELQLNVYEASKCPLCKEGVPINTKIGHGKKFLEGKK